MESKRNTCKSKQNILGNKEIFIKFLADVRPCTRTVQYPRRNAPCLKCSTQSIIRFAYDRTLQRFPLWIIGHFNCGPKKIRPFFFFWTPALPFSFHFSLLPATCFLFSLHVQSAVCRSRFSTPNYRDNIVVAFSLLFPRQKKHRAKSNDEQQRYGIFPKPITGLHLRSPSVRSG